MIEMIKDGLVIATIICMLLVSVSTYVFICLLILVVILVVPVFAIFSIIDAIIS